MYCSDILFDTPFGSLMLILLIGMICFRLPLWSKMKSLADGTGLPEWKAWQLSAIEPLITTVATMMAGLVLICGVWQEMLYLPLLSMVSFAFLIRYYGQRSRRGRLANSVLRARLGLLSTAFLVGDFLVGIVPLVLFITAPILRVGFGLYQSQVTPTLMEYEQAQTAEHIRIPAIEDGLGELELWDEQVALIERLKAGGGAAEPSPDQASAIADPLVTENDGMVGRAQELL